MEIGLNLWSIRTMLSDEKNVLQTFEKLKEMGISYVQYSGCVYNVDVLKKAAKVLPIVLTHVPYDRIINDTDKLIEEHKEFGCKNIGNGCFPYQGLFDKEKCIEIIDNLERVAIKMEENGMKLFHHHHSIEFNKLFGEKRIWDVLMERAPHLNITLDTYWMQYAGAPVNEYIEKLSGRVGCIHLKDYIIEGDTPETLKPAFERVGYGNMNFHDIVSAAKKSGTEYFLIEQDDACDKPNTLGLIEDSVNYCRSEL